MTEFGLIDTIRDMFAAIPRNGFDGIGDDCTVFPLGSGESLVFTADLLAENIHSTGSAPTIPSQTNGTKGTPSSFLLTKIVKNPDIRRKILRFASNSHTFHTRPKVGTTRAPKINFRILPALAIFAEDRMRFGNFQEQVLIIALGFRYLCRR